MDKILLRYSFIFLLLSLFSCTNNNNQDKEEGVVVDKISDNKIVGYIIESRVDSLDSKVFDLCSHLIIIDGAHSNENSHLHWRDKQNSKNIIKKLQKLRGDRDCKILFCVAGKIKHWNIWQGAPETRAMFIADLKQFCVETKIDGIDINAEHPNTNDEQKQHGILIKELAQELHKGDYMLSSAVLFGLNGHIRAIHDHVDLINVMIYDNMDRNGIHSRYSEHVRYLEQMKSANFDLKKIVAGVPFYGYKGGPSWDNLKSLTYSELVRSYKVANDVDLVDGYSFNGVNTIRKKTEITKQMGFGGMMILEVSYDVSPNVSNSLLKNMYEVLYSK